MKSPVALFVFRRPELTARVLAAIRLARPSLLLVVADGPRAPRPDDAAACVATRELIDQIDWPCEVRREFAAENMGCRRRIASGLAWVFDQVPEAIILEDDCVPDQTFFRFCDELLEKYRDDNRIAQISGSNNQNGRKRGSHSYFYSRYNNVWGWATWRRAFELYDVDIKKWPELRATSWLSHIVGKPAEVNYWTRVFDATHEGRVDTWDYQWIFSTWQHGMLSVVPNHNLVQNIGFGDDATHTASQDLFANSRLEPMPFPLDHPPAVAAEAGADRYTARFEFGESWLVRARKSLRARVLQPLMRRLRLALDIPVTHAYPAFSIELPPEHLLPGYQRMFPDYDRFLPHLATFFDAGDVVIDVGANCGDTLAGMCSANPALAFACIEPDAKFFAYLQRNARRIEAAFPNVSIHLVQSLVGDRPEAAALSGSGGTKTARWITGVSLPAGSDSGLHHTVRLDAIVAAHPGIAPARIRLLKSDVDGYDFDVLNSAGGLLDSERLLLFFECFADNDEQRAGFLHLFEQLDARGFRRFCFLDNYGAVHRREVFGVDAAHAVLGEVWAARGIGGGRGVDYLDVLAYRDADASLIQRVVSGYLPGYPPG